MKKPSFTIICLLLLASLSHSCRGTKYLSLDPPNARPVYAVQVADATEAELLQQQLGLEIVRADLPAVYFYGDRQNVLAQLEAIGYAKPELQRPVQFYHHYAKLVGKWEEKTVLDSGLKIINRERDHVVVYGSLDNLQTARSRGLTLLKLDYEIHPREIELRVRTVADIQTVANLHVDIVSVGQAEKGESYIVQGTAFDSQIDELKKLGFTVTQK